MNALPLSLTLLCIWRTKPRYSKESYKFLVAGQKIIFLTDKIHFLSWICEGCERKENVSARCDDHGEPLWRIWHGKIWDYRVNCPLLICCPQCLSPDVAGLHADTLTRRVTRYHNMAFKCSTSRPQWEPHGPGCSRDGYSLFYWSQQQSTSLVTF